MPPVTSAAAAKHQPINARLLPACLIALVSLTSNQSSADEPAAPIDFSPIPKYIKPEPRQAAQDQPAAANAAATTSAPVGTSMVKGFDITSSSQKWTEPARIEEIHSVDGNKHYLIVTPLPVPYCVTNKRNSPNQNRMLCENVKF